MKIGIHIVQLIASRPHRYVRHIGVKGPYRLSYQLGAEREVRPKGRCCPAARLRFGGIFGGIDVQSRMKSL